jgi:hypothetical protein
LEDKRLGPLKHYYLLKKGAKATGMVDMLWGTEKGKSFSKIDPTLYQLTKLSRKVGTLKDSPGIQ